MAEINWTDQAVSDLKNIAEYIAADSPKFAIITIQSIRSKVKQLVEFPESGRIVPEVENEKIRELIFGNYRIIYRLFSSQRVDILTVHHSARRLEL